MSVKMSNTSKPLRKVKNSGNAQKLQGAILQGGIFDSLAKVVAERKRNEVIALAVGTAISAIVVRAVDDFTELLFGWAHDTNVFGPLHSALQIPLLGNTLDLTKLFGIAVYVVIALAVLSFVAFGILAPLLDDGRDDEEAKPKPKA